MSVGKDSILRAANADAKKTEVKVETKPAAIYAFHSLSLIEAAVKVSAFPLLPVIYLISCGVASSHSFPL